MRIVTGLSGSLLILALAVSGCGGDSDKEAKDASGSTSTATDEDKDDEKDDDSGSEPLDVCGLITLDDLQKTFGSPFDEGDFTHQEQTGGDQCVWTSTDGPPVKSFSITVTRQDHLEGAIKQSGISVKELFEQSKEYMPGAEDYDLGDDAYLAKSELAVLDGETLYNFSTFLGTSPEAIAGLKALAAQVVG